MPESAITLPNDPTFYAYKPALTGASSAFQLEDDAIAWDRAGTVVRVPYRDIRRVRLAFRPMTMQPYRFMTEIWSMGGTKLAIGSCSLKSVIEQPRHDVEYNAFLAELHRRLVPFRAGIRFQTGSPFLLYWIGVAVFAGLCISAAGLIFRALEIEAWLGAALVAGMLGFFLWQAGGFLRRNKPSVYTPDHIPAQALP
jgi:hypothetical protein